MSHEKKRLIKLLLELEHQKSIWEKKIPRNETEINKLEKEIQEIRAETETPDIVKRAQGNQGRFRMIKWNEW